MKAKTIVENKFWILEEEDGERVGTVSIKPNGVIAVIKNQSLVFNDLEELTDRFNISFKKQKISKPAVTNEVYGYPTAHTPHNALWYVEKGMPIYTKTSKSNSYHCAGYYIIRFSHGWVKTFCPKLITLQRYDYHGPYKTKIEMVEQLRVHNAAI